MHDNRSTIDIPKNSRSTYSIVEQEVNIGVQALKSDRAEMAVTLFRSALQKLTVEQPFYDHLVHNLLLGYKLCVDVSLKAGDVSAAASFLRRALELEIRGAMTSDADFRQRFAGAMQEIGLMFFHHRMYRESVLCARRAISICASPSSHINLSNALSASGGRAVLSDFTTDITPDQLGRHIFIACAPKSGSTFLKNTLLSLSGYRDVFMVYSPDQFEQEIYLPTLLENAQFDSVTQQHCRASNTNVQLMQAFGIRPVILVRNIFDSVMSLFDFYNKGAYLASFYRIDYESLEAETKLDLLIDNLIPWYFQFFASWSEAERQKKLDVMWLTYEELIADKPTSIQNVLKFYGLGAWPGDIEQKVRESESEQRKTRFNKGLVGRGSSGLTERQKARISRFSKYYPSVNFGRIGL
jgi:hypothetical protein